MNYILSLNLHTDTIPFHKNFSIVESRGNLKLLETADTQNYSVCTDLIKSSFAASWSEQYNF